MKFKSNRSFVLFDYNMSLSQLVLRSFKDDENEMNLDIIFFGVSRINSGVNFDFIHLDWNTENSEDDFEFRVSDEQNQAVIIGSFFNVVENSFDFGESSVFKNTETECKILYTSKI